VAVDPGTHTEYVANTGDNTVSVIDAATRIIAGFATPGPSGTANCSVRQ
jgi:DNA-binding beta-propeller fold protein YncE